MATLYYIHDPMCSWCWGFNKTWQKLQKSLPSLIDVRYLVGGLAPDSNTPMPQELKDYLPTVWQMIQKKIPGTEFNFDFWQQCEPRRSTYPACRAVLAAKLLDADKESQMIQGIQEAYYLQAKNPSDIPVLVNVAKQIGVDEREFTNTISSPQVEAMLQNDINQSRVIGANGFPSLVLKVGEDSNEHYHAIPIDYNNPNKIKDNILAVL